MPMKQLAAYIVKRREQDKYKRYISVIYKIEAKIFLYSSCSLRFTIFAGNCSENLDFAVLVLSNWDLLLSFQQHNLKFDLLHSGKILS